MDTGARLLSLANVSYHTSPGAPLALESGWQATESTDSEGPTANLVGNVVVLQGLIQTSDGAIKGEGLGSLSSVARVASAMNPPTDLFFAASGDNTSADLPAVIRISKAGVLSRESGEITNRTQSFSGIAYSIAPGTPLALESGYSAPTGEEPAYSCQDGTVLVSGRVNLSGVENAGLLAVLPDGMRPRFDVVFMAATGDGEYARIRVNTLGEIRFELEQMSAGQTWVSLSNVHFPAQSS